MPDTKTREQIIEGVYDILDEYYNRNDIDGMVAYMKQVTMSVNNDYDDASVETDPRRAAMIDYIGGRIAAELDAHTTDFARNFTVAASRLGAKTAIGAIKKERDLEEQIRNGEIEDCDFFAQSAKNTEKLACYGLTSKAKYKEDIDAVREVGQMLSLAIDRLHEEGVTQMGWYERECSGFLEDKYENGQLVQRNLVAAESLKVLESDKSLTEKDHMVALNFMAAGVDMNAFGYSVTKANTGVFIDELPEERIKCKGLNAQQLEDRRNQLESQLAEYDSPSIVEAKKLRESDKIGLTGRLTEVKLAQKRFALENADPALAKEIAVINNNINAVASQEDALNTFKMSVNDFKAMTANVAKFFAEDKAARGNLNPKSHAEYLKLARLTSELAELEPGQNDPKQIVDKLKELQDTAHKYYKSHASIFRGKEGTERYKNAQFIGTILDDNIERLEAIAGELQGTLAPGQTIDGVLADYDQIKKSLRAEVKNKKEILMEKAAHPTENKAAEVKAEENKPSEAKAKKEMSGVVEIDLDDAEVPEIEEDEPEIQTRPRSNAVYKSNKSAKAEDEINVKVGRISVTRADVSPEIKAKSYSVSSSQKAIRNIMENSGEINAETKAEVGTYMARIIATCIVRDKEKTISTNEAQVKIDKTFAAVEESKPFKNMMAKANTDASFRKLVDKALTKKPNELMVEFAAEYAKYKEQNKTVRGKNGEKLERIERVNSIEDVKKGGMIK